MVILPKPVIKKMNSTTETPLPTVITVPFLSKQEKAPLKDVPTRIFRNCKCLLIFFLCRTSPQLLKRLFWPGRKRNRVWEMEYWLNNEPHRCVNKSQSEWFVPIRLAQSPDLLKYFLTGSRDYCATYSLPGGWNLLLQRNSPFHSTSILHIRFFYHLIPPGIPNAQHPN